MPARRLGLVTAHEAPLSPEEQDRLAGLLEEQLDIDALLRDLPAVDLPPVPPPASKTGGRRVAVAFDAAFCFLYPDLPEMLEESGAHCAFFSPLEDAGLPEAELLYLPGGYPELFAARLAANASLREALRAFAASGRPVYGECGGYIYLMESVRADGVEYPMSGLLPLRCDAGAQRAALGYRQVRPAGPGFFAPNEEKPVGRGHEFHYARLTHRPSGLPALWLPEDRTGKALAPEGTLSGNVAGSWVHLAPHGAKALWNNFLRAGART